jgi:NADH-quinone oxidoreductase subunit M
VFTILATAGIILAALYILLMVQRTMHGPPRGVLLAREETTSRTPVPAGDGGATAVLEAPAHTPRLQVADLSRRELAVVAPLVALIVVLGVYPQPLIDLVRPAVAATMGDIGSDPAGITPTHPVTEGTK